MTEKTITITGVTATDECRVRMEKLTRAIPSIHPDGVVSRHGHRHAATLEGSST